MAPNEVFKRYIEAGIAFTEMTRTRAEEVVRELAQSGEVQWDQVQGQVDELITWSRRNSEQALTFIRTEVASQLSQLGVATMEHLQSVEKRLEDQINQRLSTIPGRRRPAAPATGPAGGQMAAPKKAAPTKAAPKRAAATTKAATKKAAGTTKAATKKAAGTTKAATKKAAVTTTAATKSAAGTTTAATKNAAGTTKGAPRKAATKAGPTATAKVSGRPAARSRKG